MKGITKRWVLNTFAVILIILCILIIAFALIVQNFYYNGIRQTLSGRSSELVNIFRDVGDGSETFIERARDYVEDFPDKEQMELMVINRSGKAVINSTGFSPDNSEAMTDYDRALSSKEHYGDWHGENSSGENIMALTRVITSSANEPVGAIRYVVSLEEADRKIFIAISFVCLIGLLIMFFIFISSTYFLSSIVRPVREISETAKKIAQGDFNARIDKFYDDEIGDLCDTINYMAGELGTADKLKNDFISSVSHELRTPLTAIKGWAETMQLDGFQDKRTLQKGINIIIKEAERLGGIVEEVLDFSRIQQDRMVLIMDRVDLIAELDESIYMLKEKATRENKHITYEAPEMLPIIVGDRNRLRQVFINIIDNALKYSSSDAIVNITAATDEAEDNITITVADNGCGISAEDLPKVKQKFYKANQTVRGSGIGLAVADEIVKLHHGTLDIDSTEGVGTTVTITIPVIKEQEEEEQEEAGEEE